MLRNEQGLTEKEFLDGYDSNKYIKPSVTADVLLFTIDNIASDNYKKNDEKVLKLLLIKRKNHPFMNTWALPGGFVDPDESLEKAALRELKEETDIDDLYIEQLFTFSEVKRDPRMRVISTSFMALVDASKLNPKAGDDAEEVDWFEIKKEIVKKHSVEERGQELTKKETVKLIFQNEKVGDEVSCTLEITESLIGKNIERKVRILEQKNLGFDHGKVVDYALQRLKNKLEYTSIAFNLVPDFFTLTELQNVYQVISGKSEKPAGFRRKIKDMVIETEQMQTSKGHRPARLFKYNKFWNLK